MSCEKFVQRKLDVYARDNPGYNVDPAESDCALDATHNQSSTQHNAV
jgi:hypothetical protein